MEAAEQGTGPAANARAEPRRLLVITYVFPPDGAVGGLRWAGFSKYLARRGWEIHVITAAHGDANTVPSSVNRHVVTRRRTLNDVYNGAARSIRSRAGGGGRKLLTAKTAASSSPSLPIGPVRQFLRNALVFPDVGRGWIQRAAAAARRLLREQRFDVVVSSGPPHSCHIVGLLATLGSDTPFIMDMRDPWRQTHKNWSAYPTGAGWFESVVRVIQVVLFRRARMVLVNTPQFAERMEREHPNVSVAYVRNGIDLDGLPDRTDVRLPGLTLSYIGTLYVGRNFSTVLNGLQSLRKERPTAASNVRVHVAGHMDAPNQARLDQALRALGLSDLVELHGPLPRREALELLCQSHVALVLAQEQPMQIPAKLYECIALAVPTLVITEAGSAAALEAERLGAMTLDPDDVDGMRAILDDLVDGKVPTRMLARAPISYEALAARMDTVLRGQLTT